MRLDNAVFALLFIAIAGFVILVKLKTSQRLQNYMSKLGGELGIPFHKGEPLLPGRRFGRLLREPSRLEGNLEGRKIKITHYTKSSGKNSRTFATAVATIDNPRDLRLTIAADNFLSAIGRKLGMQDVPIGEEAFDKRFVVKSKDPAFAQSVMLPEIRALFFKAWDEHAARGILKLKGSELRYDEQGSISSGAAMRRFTAISRLCVRLADAVEAYSDIPNSSRADSRELDR